METSFYTISLEANPASMGEYGSSPVGTQRSSRKQCRLSRIIQF